MGGGVTTEVNDLPARLEAARAAREAGDLALAERLFRAAAERLPDEPEPLHHLGGLLLGRGGRAEAEACYRRVLALAPGADATARVLGVMLLEDGRYPEGFALLEARHFLPGMGKPALPFPEWRGEPLAGKTIVVWPEQGFGDQIMFARFAPRLREMGAEVTLICRPGLERLFEASLGLPTLAAAGAVEFPDPDYWVMLGDLPARFGVTPQTLSGKPYLKAPLAGPDLGPGFKVGLKVRGNPAYLADAHRSAPAEAAAALAALPARIVSLEPEDTGAKDFAETAALVERLDLVISVDTSVAHLAAAMGKPTWILLSAAKTDWRWMRDRADSPWYEAVRLFRQPAPGDWMGLIAEVRQALAGLNP